MAWMGSKANIAAITALNTAGLEDGIVFWAIAEKLWLGLDKTSTDTVNNTSVWSATPSGRWLLVGGSGGGGGGSVTVSNSPPGAIAPSGTTHIWTENANSYPADSEGRLPNSLITYVSNGSIWLVTSANLIIYSGDPISLGKPPNSVQEAWIDTSTTPSTRYGATINSSSGLTWEGL